MGIPEDERRWIDETRLLRPVAMPRPGHYVKLNIDTLSGISRELIYNGLILLWFMLARLCYDLLG